MARLLIGATSSGTGKTTISAGIMRAYRKRGLPVQPFKVGPDYIDPGYHYIASGTPSRNLDGWMCGKDHVLNIVSQHSPPRGISIIEGVMGLYDGYGGTSEAGSTAEVAKLTGTPVVLVINAAKMARSAAAIALGYKLFDPDIKLAGVILNNVGSLRHFKMLQESIEKEAGINVFGYFPRDESIKLEERHLGLLTTEEGGGSEAFFEKAALMAEEYIDLDRLLKCAAEDTDNTLLENKDTWVVENISKQSQSPSRIAIAKDEAFLFYYQENLDLLRKKGAELVEFSPLHDTKLPVAIDGIYIGGGYPESFAARLAENSSLKEDIKNKAEAGLPVFAECGGLMYLLTQLVDFEGESHEMVGIFPGNAVMGRKKRALGYREIEALEDTIILRKGEMCRGHEFHWSHLEDIGLEEKAFFVKNKGFKAGLVHKNVLASYLHIHFLSNQKIAETFINKCLENRKKLPS